MSLQDVHELVTRNRGAKKQLEGIDESGLAYQDVKDSTVGTDKFIGYEVTCPYSIFNAKEFVQANGADVNGINNCNKDGKRNKKDPNIVFTRIRNELNKLEDVVIARRGPRKLNVKFSSGIKMTEAVMEKLVRKGQAAKTFKWASEFEQFPDLAFHKKMSRTPTTEQVRQRADALNEELKKREARENHRAKDVDGNELESEDEQQEKKGGLKMPSDDDEAPAAARQGSRKSQKTAAGGPPGSATKRPRWSASSIIGSGASVAGTPVNAMEGINLTGSKAGADTASRAGGATVVGAGGGGGRARTMRSVRSEAPAGKAAASFYLDISKILTGESGKPALNGAKRHLETLAGNTKAYNSLDKEIKCAELCLALAPADRKKLPFATFQKKVGDVRVTMGKAFALPFCIYLDLVSQFATSIIEVENYEEFSEVIRPWVYHDDPRFSETTLRFGTLIKYQAKGEAVQDLLRDVAEAIREAFFSNEICNLFHEPLDQGYGVPYLVADACLSRYAEACEEEDVLVTLDSKFVVVYDMIMCVCRAIIACSCPVPGKHNSCYNDVVKVFFPELLTGEEVPDEVEEEDPIAKELQATARENYLHIRTAAMKNSHWKARLNAYLQLGLEDCQIQQEYNKVAEGFNVQDMAAVDTQFVTQAVAKMTEWTQKLRAGALVDLERFLSRWTMSARTKLTDECEQSKVDIARAILKVVNAVDSNGRNADLQAARSEASDLVVFCEGFDAKSALNEIVGEPSNAVIAGLGTCGIQAKLDMCKGVEISAAMVPKLLDYEGFLYTDLVRIVNESNRKPADWDANIIVAGDVVKAIRALPAVKAQVAEGTVADERVWKDFKEFATEILMFKSLVASTMDAEDQELLDLVMPAMAAYFGVKKKATAARNVREYEGQLHDSLSAYLGGSREGFVAKLMTARQTLRTDLAKALGKLHRVAGGKDDGGLWKADVPATAEFDDMQGSLELLAGAFCDAIAKRFNLMADVMGRDSFETFAPLQSWARASPQRPTFVIHDCRHSKRCLGKHVSLTLPPWGVSRARGISHTLGRRPGELLWQYLCRAIMSDFRSWENHEDRTAVQRRLQGAQGAGRAARKVQVDRLVGRIFADGVQYHGRLEVVGPAEAQEARHCSRHMGDDDKQAAQFCCAGGVRPRAPGVVPALEAQWHPVRRRQWGRWQPSRWQRRR